MNLKPILTTIFFFGFIALTLTANVETIPIYTCHCRTDLGFEKQGRRLIPITERDTITANDFWYERNRFVYTLNGDTLERANTYAYCTDFWNRNLLPIRR